MQFPKECEQYEKIIVTRHSILIDYLIEQGLIDKNANIQQHVSREDIENKHVIGILPMHLACHAAMFTEIPLRIPYDKKQDTLTLEQIGFYIQEPKTYIIKELK